jgi:hypothetical protein
MGVSAYRWPEPRTPRLAVPGTTVAFWVFSVLEAGTGIEPVMGDLQSPALPLGYPAGAGAG